MDQPIAYSVRGAVAATGYSRAYIYQKISAGLLDVRKDGGKTVIIGQSLRDYIAALPAMPSKGRQTISAQYLNRPAAEPRKWPG